MERMCIYRSTVGGGVPDAPPQNPTSMGGFWEQYRI